MTRAYRALGGLSVLAGVTCFGLIVLASLGLVGDLRIVGISFWPLVVLTLITSIFVASWAYTKAMRRSGWFGILLPLLDVFGLKILFNLEDHTASRKRPDA